MAETLDAWMLRTGRTNEALALEMGRHWATVSRWRSGRRIPPPQDLIRLHAISGGVTFDWVAPIQARRAQAGPLRVGRPPACRAVQP